VRTGDTLVGLVMADLVEAEMTAGPRVIAGPVPSGAYRLDFDGAAHSPSTNRSTVDVSEASAGLAGSSSAGVATNPDVVHVDANAHHATNGSVPSVTFPFEVTAAPDAAPARRPPPKEPTAQQPRSPRP